jgi:hypothetical protein
MLNNVLLPRKNCVLIRTELDNIDQKIRKIIKSSVRLPNDTPTALIHNHLVYGIESIIAQHAAYHITNAVTSAQKTGPVGEIMSIRAIQAMNKYHLSHHPLAYPCPTQATVRDP